MQYVTVFDASAAPYRNIYFLLPGLVFIVVGIGMVFYPKFFDRLGFRPSPTQPWFKPFAIFFLLFALLWTGGAGSVVLGHAWDAKQAVERHDCRTIEGRVENFHPMPASGHDTERFKVAGIEFSYSDYIVTAGFNQSASHGGPIREGLPVRLCYRDGEILRLEVAK